MTHLEMDVTGPDEVPPQCLQEPGGGAGIGDCVGRGTMVSNSNRPVASVVGRPWTLPWEPWVEVRALPRGARLSHVHQGAGRIGDPTSMTRSSLPPPAGRGACAPTCGFTVTVSSQAGAGRFVDPSHCEPGRDMAEIAH